MSIADFIADFAAHVERRHALARQAEALDDVAEQYDHIAEHTRDYRLQGMYIEARNDAFARARVTRATLRALPPCPDGCSCKGVA